MDAFLIYVAVLLFILYLLCVPYMRMMKDRVNLPPGPTPLPLIGTLWKIDFRNVAKSLQEMNQTYGDIFTVYYWNQPYVVLCGYRAIKETFIDKAEEFSGRGPFPTFYNFTKGDGAPIDLTDCLGRSVSNVICSVVFGHRFDYSDKTFQKMVKSIQDNFNIMSSRWGTLYNIYSNIMDYIPGPHKHLETNFKTLTDFLTKRMVENKKTLDHNCPRDYIDCFLMKIEKERNNFNSYFNPTTLVMTAMLLFFGGTETTNATLRYAFLLLMKYPKMAERVYKEIDDVIGQNRLPNWDDKTKMPYTDAFIHEVQRYADVIPLGIPHQLTMDTQIRDYKLLKGTNFISFLTSVHHDKSQFKNPELFEPRNFLDENERFRKNNALMSFSAGKRICPGETLAVMELFLFFTIILQKFTVTSLVPPEEISIAPRQAGMGNIPPEYEICLVPR